MLSILINAYACSPNMGSEPGMAWNWCINLAKYCELHIITEGEFREKIESALPTLKHGSNMHFYYNPVSDKVRRMCWNQGDWRFYYYYQQWQRRTLAMAREIIETENIDILHQLNMIGFREPGFLWKIEHIPFVWGPINSKEAFPLSYLDDSSLKHKLFFRIKNTVNSLQLIYSIRVRQAARSAKVVIAASGDAANSIVKYWHIAPMIINESGSDIVTHDIKSKDFNKPELTLLWVGRFIFSKQLVLALRTLALLNTYKFKLHIVGGSPGEEAYYQSMIRNAHWDINCEWHGKVTHPEVQELMQKSDLLFFTSIAEGTPHVILEAISNHLPVICFDTCGQGDCVNEKVGIKIPLSTPRKSVQDFADHLNYLYEHRELLKEMSENCRIRQKELSWNRKAGHMLDLYQKVLEK
jgi:glycosyltransferase involved in cell wall biosynthesis